MRRAAAVIVLALVGAAPAGAQLGSEYQWPTELAAGAAADLVARGPWIRKDWRRSPTFRICFATGLSISYELVELWNGQANAGRWEDVAMRLVGTLALEGLLGIFERQP